ncbi:MAG: Transcriptional regulator, TrmB [Candidatus Saccharibacteria bacterium GW2011_GWA2_46_10]|nr:MAG: Transcriptional regulator, TrmB [Candidatus Saccharibacteria bacterium GW2011_GWA2_46_10]
MLHKDLQKILESVGLSQRDAALYLTGLEIGNDAASAYAKKTELNRITCFNALEKLVEKGIFTSIRHERGKRYAPVAPELLALETRKSAHALDRVLTELKSMQGTSHKRPIVRFFAGWEGVRHVYDDTLTAGSEILNFANSEIVRRFWKNYDEEYVSVRAKKKIFLRGIAPDDPEGKRVHMKDEECFREIRLVKDKEFNFNNEINIYDNKVAIVSFCEKPDDVFGIIIESKEVADTQRQIFEMAWRYAGKRKT